METGVDTHRVVRSILSAALIAGANTDRIDTAPLQLFLSYYRRQEVTLDGTTYPASAPNRPPVTPSAIANLRKLGIQDGQQLMKVLDEQQTRWPCLSDRQLTAIFPGLAPILEALMFDGPALAAERGTEALLAYAKDDPRPNRRRDDGKAAGTLNIVRHAGHKVFAALVQAANLAGAEAPSELKAWSWAPSLPLPEANGSGFNPEAPPLNHLRLCFEELTLVAREMLGGGAGDYADERRIIESAAMPRLLRAYTPLRHRLMLATYFVLGGRTGAMSRITLEDYEPTHRGPRPDYRLGPALGIYPRKGLPRNKRRFKGLHPEVGLMLESFILLRQRVWRAAYAGEIHLQAYKEGVGRVQSTGRPEVPMDAGLFTESPFKTRALAGHSLSKALAGATPSYVYPRPQHRRRHSRRRPYFPWHHPNGFRPLLPRLDYAPPEQWVHERAAVWQANAQKAGREMPALTFNELSDLLAQFVGYTAHEIRHLTYQQAAVAGELFNQDHVAPPAFPHPDPKLYAAAFLDHSAEGVEGKLAATYNDRNSERAYEHLSLRVGPVLWELLTGDIGLRKVPDGGAIREVYVQLVEVEQRLNAQPRHFEALKEKPALRRPAPRVLPPVPATARMQQKLDIVIDQNHALQADIQHLIDQGEELRSIVLASGGILLMAMELAEQRMVLFRKLEELRLNPKFWRRVPDNEQLSEQDLRHIELEELGRVIEAPQTSDVQREAKRDWLLGSELMRVADITNRATISRWLRGESLPPADRRPWEASAIPAELVIVDQDGKSNEKYRRIWVPGISPTFWRNSLMRELRDELLARWPTTKGWTNVDDGGPSPRALRPLVLPEPFATRYAEAQREADLEANLGQLGAAQQAE